MANCLKILLVFLQGWGALNYAPAVVNTWWWFALHGCIFHEELQVCSTHTNLQLPWAIITWGICIYIWVPARCAHFSDIFKMWIAVLKLFLHLFFSLFKDQESEDVGSKKGSWKMILKTVIWKLWHNLCFWQSFGGFLSCLSVDHQSGWYDARL